MLLSIIMPVYNAEEFIIECLNSIVCQLLPNTELIIVDDFSTDNSKTILIEYLNELEPEKSKLIKLISLKENKGVGYTRTVAISNSCGKYICSIDPDDMVSNNFILRILKILENYSPDILQFHISRFFKKIDDKYILSSHFLNEGLYMVNSEIKKKFYEQNFWSFCTRVIRKELFNNIDFSNLRNCEDVYALPLILAKTKKIYILNDDLYYYRLNPDSLSKSNKNINNAINSYSFIINNYIQRLKEDPNLYFALIPILRNYISFCLDCKGYKAANLELIKFKEKKVFFPIRDKNFNKLTHNFFVLFGVNFLFILRLIGK